VNGREWIIRCAARLHAQWPCIGREQRNELASEPCAEGHWQSIEPEQAAIEWLRQGMPNVARQRRWRERMHPVTPPQRGRLTSTDFCFEEISGARSGAATD
jgi:hypothetical protein